MISLIKLKGKWRSYRFLDQVLAPKWTDPKNGIPEPNPAYRKRLTHDKFALTCLMLAITEEIGCNLLRAKTSHEARQILHPFRLANGCSRGLSRPTMAQCEKWELLNDRLHQLDQAVGQQLCSD